MNYKTQKQIILNMLSENPWVCVTEFMSAHIPDYRRRLCDIRDAGYELEGRSCKQHQHTSQNLKEWRLVHIHEGRTPNMWKLEGYSPEETMTYRGKLAITAPEAENPPNGLSSPYTGRIMQEMAELTQPRLFVN